MVSCESRVQFVSTMHNGSSSVISSIVSLTLPHTTSRRLNMFNGRCFVSLKSSLLFSINTYTQYYSSIAEAVQLADPGERIVVHPGVYNEHITLNKSVSLIGVGQLL